MKFLSLLSIVFTLSFTQIFSQTVPVTLHYKPVIEEFTTLRLVGNFNGWNNNDPNMVMTDPDGDGVYEITREFVTGVEHMYKFVFDANWSFAWNDPNNPNIKLSDNNNSILNVTDPYITYLLPRGINSAGNKYVDTTIIGEPIRAIFAYTEANPIDINSLVVTIDGVNLDNPSQYYIPEKKEFYYQPPIPLGAGDHTVEVSITSAAGTVIKSATFQRIPGLVVYKAPVDFYYDEFNPVASKSLNINSVSLVGEFNNWNETFNRMNDDNGDGLWEETIYMEGGTYEYLFKLNNSIWFNDPDEPNFSTNNQNNVFTVVIDSIPSIKLLSPNEGTVYSELNSTLPIEILLRPGTKSNGVDEGTISLTLNGIDQSFNFDSETNILSSNVILANDGDHLVEVSFTNLEGLSSEAHYSYGVYTGTTGYYYTDAIDDEPYTYPAGVADGSADILSLLIDEVLTHDSLKFSIEIEDITDRTRVGLIITNPAPNDVNFATIYDIHTENWENRGIHIPIGAPGNTHEVSGENNVWTKLDSLGSASISIDVNQDAMTSNKFEFAISLAYLDSLLGSWTRERNFYVFSYLANDDLSGDSFEITSAEGGNDNDEDPDVYDAAFFRSGFWQSRVFANYIPLGGSGGPRIVSLNGFQRGKKAFNAGDISDSLAVYGAAITFLTPAVKYWYSEVEVKGTVSDSNISTVIFSFNGIESIVDVIDSEFSVPVVLEEGTNTIFIKATDNKGFESTSDNLILIYEKDNNPKTEIVTSVNGRNVELSAAPYSPDSLSFTYYWTDDDEINPANVMGAASSQSINIQIPETDGEYYIDLRVRDSEGRFAYARQLIFAKDDSIYVAGINDHAGWIDNAIFYEIYPRSYSGTGNFNGIEEKIPDMLDLGINAVWLMPIYTGPTEHGYAITDYYGFEEDFGTEEDFRNLVEAFHDAGIKVILDFVVNHTSIEHPFMKNVMEFKGNSPWADWYLWDGEPGNSNHEFYFNWGTLPNLNHNNKDVRDYFINVAKYWVQEYDIDGFRCDVAWGVEERNTDFWQDWRKELKNIKPEIFLQAEASSAEPIFYQQRFDSANDWELRTDIIEVTNGTKAISVVDDELMKSYPSYARPFRFVENHDEVRVASSHGTQRSKLMHTIIMTANGVPLIYSGGEVGEKTNRGIIDWTDPDGIRPYFKSLIDIRKKYIHNPILERIETSLPSDTYAYLSTSNDDILLVLVNFKGETKDIEINITDLPDNAKYLTNLIEEELIDVQLYTEKVPISLAAFQAKVFYLGEQPVSVESNDEEIIVREFKLGQNYPNPFNPLTKIRFQLPSKEFVTLKIYDIIGREVKTLIDKEMEIGRYTVDFNAQALSSGVYFYRIQAGNFIDTKKIILLK